MRYEIFISYSRKDNFRLHPDDPKGWVEAFRDAIIAEHRSISTEPFEICLYLDLAEIKSFDDWRENIQTGLRESSILLVCLSPNYFNSPPCLWEWEEYQKRQVHAQVGQDSVTPVYFVEVPGSDTAMNAAWLEAMRRKSFDESERGEWEQRWKAWHDATMSRPNYVDLKPWFPLGAQALREKAVRERMETLSIGPTNLDQQLRNLGTALWSRIERARRSDASPSNPELRRRNRHFIGRHKELSQLHEAAHTGAVGLVTVVHGLGGQGKTELVSAYAHAWAYSYPAGRWFLPAEGKRELVPLIGELRAALNLAHIPDESVVKTGHRVLAELKRCSHEAASRDPDGRPACLLILDNVSDPLLLAEPQLDQLPEETWLHVIATTRESPDSFPATPEKSLIFIPLDSLPQDDATKLLEEHQLHSQWPAATAAEDAAAAREIARELGGFTLGVECVAIHLGIHPSIRPDAYLARLKAEGLPSVDTLPADATLAARMRHHEKQLSLVLESTLAASKLTPPELTALNYASCLPPDNIPWDWLQSLVTDDHPDEMKPKDGYPYPWDLVKRRLTGLRLLTTGAEPEKTARMHRMVAAEFAGGWADSAIPQKEKIREMLKRRYLPIVTHKAQLSPWEIRCIMQLLSRELAVDGCCIEWTGLHLILSEQIRTKGGLSAAIPLARAAAFAVEREALRSKNSEDILQVGIRHSHLGWLYLQSGNVTEAMRWLDRAEQILRPTCLREGAHIVESYELGTCLQRRGDLAVEMGDNQKAYECFMEVFLLADRGMKAMPGDKQWRIASAIASSRISKIHLAANTFDKARVSIMAAIQVAAPMLQNPNDLSARKMLALCMEQLGDIEAATKNYATAAAWYHAESELNRECLIVCPDDMIWQADLASSIVREATAKGLSSECIEESCKLQEEAVGIMRRLVRADPSTLQWHYRLMTYAYDAAKSHEELGNNSLRRERATDVKNAATTLLSSDSGADAACVSDAESMARKAEELMR